MSYGQIARGLNDVQIYKLVANDAFDSTAVDVPGARTFGWSTASDSEPWEGDDTVVAQSANAPTGSGTIASAKVGLPALAVIKGGSVTTTGTTPAQISTWEESGAANTNYFGAVGQSNAADGGAYRVTIHKAIASEISEELAVNSWNEPTISFEFLPNSQSKYITREQYETAVTIGSGS